MGNRGTGHTRPPNLCPNSLDSSAEFHELRSNRMELIRAIQKNRAEGIQRLLTDLYPDRAHFIYELLQNAEDAQASRVRFDLFADRLEVVHDGRRLFTAEDIDSITNIGSSTKRDDMNQIGKFGIGFKAVFAYTRSPCIQSGHAAFKITDLILPDVVGCDAEVAQQSLTRFVFPFDSPSKAPERCVLEIAGELCQLPDTALLFLNHIKTIGWRNELDRTEGEVTRQEYPGDPHAVAIRRRGNDACTVDYWLRYRKPLPDGSLPVALAFRLTAPELDDGTPEPARSDEDPGLPVGGMVIGRTDPGQLCIFFPAAKEVTGLGFHIHAPFASTVSRESIPHERSGNPELFSRLGELLHEALRDIAERKVSSLGLIQALALSAHDSHASLSPLHEGARAAMLQYPLIPAANGGFVAGRNAVLARGQDSVRLLNDTQLASLLGRPGSRWCATDISDSGRLRDVWDALTDIVGVCEVRPEELAQKLAAPFLNEQPVEWLVRLYEFLGKSDRLKDVPAGCPLVRTADGAMVDSRSVPVFFPPSEDGTGPEPFVPGTLPAEVQVPYHCISRELDASLANHTKAQDLRCWLSEKLKLRRLDPQGYAECLLRHFQTGTCAPETLLVGTLFIAAQLPEQPLGALPVLLNTGEVVWQRRLPLVTSESLDPDAGWQHVWVTPEDRSHFCALSDRYLDAIAELGNASLLRTSRGDLARRLGASAYPPFRRRERNCGWEYKQYSGLVPDPLYGHTFSVYQRRIIEGCIKTRSAMRWVNKMALDDVVMPTPFQVEPTHEPFGWALLAWLRSLPRDHVTKVGSWQAKESPLTLSVTYRNRDLYQCHDRSSIADWLRSCAWLPTAKGMVHPQDAFLDRRQTRDILGDGVPYVDLGDQADALCDLLGVRRSIDEGTLVDLLRKQKNGGSASVDLELCKRVYGYLASHCTVAPGPLRAEALIPVPGDDGKCTWRAVGELIWRDRRELFGPGFGYLEPHYADSDLKRFFCSMLGVAEDVTVDNCMAWLRQASAGQSTDEVHSAKVYGLLADRLGAYPIRPDNGRLCRKAFAEEALIHDPHAGRWLTSAHCLWPNRRDVLGDQFAYLEPYYLPLQSFFVELLGVKMEVDDGCYADRWLALQEQKRILDPEELDQALSAIYAALLSVIDEQSDDLPEWWDDFAHRALVFCEDGRFHEPAKCLIPDDGELQRILADTGHAAAFTYLPGMRPWKKWDPLLSRLGVQRVSAAVRRQGVSAVGPQPVQEAHFLTDPARRLILAWLHSGKGLEPSELDGLHPILQATREAHAESLEVSFIVDGSDKPVRHACPAYWDRQSSPPVLFYADGARRVYVADALLAGLVGGLLVQDDSDQDDCAVLEAMLGSDEADAIAKMEKNGWRLPGIAGAVENTGPSGTARAVGVLGSAEPAEEQHTTEAECPVGAVVHSPPDEAPPRPDIGAVDSHPTGTHTEPERSSDVPERSAPQVGSRPQSPEQAVSRPVGSSSSPGTLPADGRPHVPALSYAEMLPTSFNRPARAGVGDDDDDPMLDDAGAVRNAERRAAKLLERHQARIAEEPDPTERRKTTARTILEAPDPAVRERLFEWYRGKCQICGRTWPERDGTPFFLAAYLVERQHARWLDDPANAVCLCAEHFAQWRHAAIEQPLAVLEQVRELQLPSQGGTGDLCILFTMLGQDVQVTYCEKHMMALQKLIEASETAERV